MVRNMSLYDRLVKEKDRLGKKALRFPKTKQELLIMAKTPIKKIKKEMSKIEKSIEKINDILEEEETMSVRSNEDWEGTD